MKSAHVSASPKAPVAPDYSEMACNAHHDSMSWSQAASASKGVSNCNEASAPARTAKIHGAGCAHADATKLAAGLHDPASSESAQLARNGCSCLSMTFGRWPGHIASCGCQMVPAGCKHWQAARLWDAAFAHSRGGQKCKLTVRHQSALTALMMGSLKSSVSEASSFLECLPFGWHSYAACSHKTVMGLQSNRSNGQLAMHSGSSLMSASMARAARMLLMAAAAVHGCCHASSHALVIAQLFYTAAEDKCKRQALAALTRFSGILWSTRN